MGKWTAKRIELLLRIESNFLTFSDFPFSKRGLTKQNRFLFKWKPATAASNDSFEAFKLPCWCATVIKDIMLKSIGITRWRISRLVYYYFYLPLPVPLRKIRFSLLILFFGKAGDLAE